MYLKDEDFFEGTTRWRRCSGGHLWFNCACGSTLVMLKAKQDMLRPARFMSPEAANLFNRYDFNGSLPNFPSPLFELQKELEDPKVSIPAIAKTLRKMPFLAADLLAVASGATRGRGEPIRSIEHALVYVGRKALANLLMASALVKLSKSWAEKAVPGVSLSSFWRESFVAAALAESLVRHFKSPLPEDEVYLAACLINIGKLVGLICVPEITAKVLAIKNPDGSAKPYREAEMEVGAPSHVTLGEIGGVLWGMPVFVLESIAHHHDEPRIGGPKRSSLPSIPKLAAFANQLMHLLLQQPQRGQASVLYGVGAELGFNAQAVRDYLGRHLHLVSEVDAMLAPQQGTLAAV